MPRKKWTGRSSRSNPREFLDPPRDAEQKFISPLPNNPAKNHPEDVGKINNLAAAHHIDVFIGFHQDNRLPDPAMVVGLVYTMNLIATDAFQNFQ
jgi:hypothetical protein